MNNINKKVKQIRRRFQINGIPTFEELKIILEKLGYQLSPYKTSDRIKFGERIPPAYTFEFNDSKIIYYDSMLCDNDVVIALAHELAHICLSHTHRSDGPLDTSTYKDYEANVFVYKLFTYKENKTKNIVFAVALAICVLNLTWSSFRMNTDTKSTNVSTTASVVITGSGYKYHNSGCYIVKYKNNIIKITKTEAETLGKEPCDICIGD